ncbi:MAG: SMC-Scp complex subunit ScpB [Thermoleophilia bacterium]
MENQNQNHEDIIEEDLIDNMEEMSDGLDDAAAGAEIAGATVEKADLDGLEEFEAAAAAPGADIAGLAGADPEEGAAALARDIEALLFISPEPLALETLAEVTGAADEQLAHAVEAVRERFSRESGGIVFAEVAGGYALRTSDLARGAVERFCERPVDYSLSPAAMETLAIIAYLQPVTRPEIARIRGVGADTVVNTLVDKGLLREAGRHDETGAIRYRTSAAFEKLFGLSGLEALPSIEGFEATPEDVEELREKLHLAAEKRT